MSVLSQVVGLPGLRAAKTVSHRMITYGAWIPDILPQGRTIAGACSRDPGNTPDITKLRAGILMGRIVTVVNSLGTEGYYAPSIYGVTTNAEAVGATTIEAAAAVVTEVVRRRGATGTFKLTGASVAGGPVVTETVTYTATGATSFTVDAISNNYLAGSFIQPTDGSEDPLTFLPSGTPMNATDPDGTNQDIGFPEVPIGCIVDSSQLLPAWPGEVSLQEWIVQRLSRAAGGKFVFDHTY